MRTLIFFLTTAACDSTVKQISIEPSEEITVVTDLDGDAYSDDEDCDDNDAAINPGASELCDGVDNNCDGQIDEEVTDLFYMDSDNDGYGNTNNLVEACSAPEGYVPFANDCDDDDETAFPGAEETCDDIDNDCNGEIDEGLLSTFFIDADGDGFGNEQSAYQSCNGGVEGVLMTGDCDDSSPQINPNELEVCDAVDNNCDGQIDENTGSTFWIDGDNDGFGDPNSPTVLCELTEGFSDNSMDCNDLDSFTHPDAPEQCDGIDNNCNGTLDEDAPIDAPAYYLDLDGDGFGDAEHMQQACSAPFGYVLDSTDCDDSEAQANPEAEELCDEIDNDCNGFTDDNATDLQVFYIDADGDGFGDSSEDASIAESCVMPNGFSSDNTDCNDEDELINSDAEEVCDEIDNNCDGNADDEDPAVTDQSTWYFDQDDDGYGNASYPSTVSCTEPDGFSLYAGDCDDTSSFAELTHPNALEFCDGVDNDCDGFVDDEDDQTAPDAQTFYLDQDEDGYGDSSLTIQACEAPPGYVTQGEDCDDSLPSGSHRTPNAEEVCDEIDNDCDGVVDEDIELLNTFYADLDGDGFGDPQSSEQACFAQAQWVSNADDCNDNPQDDGANINPNSEELCDGLDNDCDELIDDQDPDVVNQSSWYFDLDGDGYGNSSIPILHACELPAGYSDVGEDCNDNEPTAFPEAPELCDTLDNNCDGQIDENVAGSWYLDYDGDGYGNPDFMESSCNQPNGFYVDNSDDCDDLLSSVYPEAPELCDTLDNNCNEDIDEGVELSWYLDSDGDGYGSTENPAMACTAPLNHVENPDDCNDEDELISPEAEEICDNIDNNCNDDTDEDLFLFWYLDLDGDGYGREGSGSFGCEAPTELYVSSTGDCNDEDVGYNPAAEEGCDGEDYNCDGAMDNDLDLDGYPDIACGGEDCNDQNPSVIPVMGGGCPLGTSCLDVLENNKSEGSGVYVIDSSGLQAGNPEDVYCDMELAGGGWTLIAVNDPTDEIWSPTLMINNTNFGTLDGGDYKSSAWNTLSFYDLMFTDGSYYAAYENVGDGSMSWFEFQLTVPLHNCGSSSGYSYPMTEGNFSGGQLCSTDLYIHPVDEDGSTGWCSNNEWADNATGPAWSAYNNGGCPLDDVSGTSFLYPGNRLPWIAEEPLMFFTR